MKPREQLTLMDKIIRELDDLKKSQTSLLKKLTQVEAENINLGSDLLNDALPTIHEEIDNSVQKVTELIDKFKDHRNEFERDNPVTEGEGQ